MSRLISCLAIASLFQSMFIPSATAENREAILSAMQSVVMVRGYNANGGLAYGSGVVIAPNKVITNCHIFRSTKEPWIARGEDVYNIQSVQADRHHDLCLLTSENLPIEPALLGKGNELKRGQDVLSIGHSNGVPAPLTSIGTIVSSYAFEAGNIIRSTAQFRMGASGSGLFNSEGQLIGINTFKTPGKHAYFYSLPVEWISSVEKLPVETVFPIEGRTFWEADDNQKPFFMQIALPEINEDWAKLEQVAKNWVSKEAKSAEAWFELGVASEQLNKIDDAQQAFQQAVTLDESYIDALFHLGLIAKEKGDKATMHSINERIVKIDQTRAIEYSRMLDCGEAC
jgi:serine protease Do